VNIIETTTHRPTSHRPGHHQPTCPAIEGHTLPVAACTVAAHPEQGWSLLCNGVVLFDDGGYLLPATAGTPSRTATSTAPAAQPVAA
jgi:hypothetical protein